MAQSSNSYVLVNSKNGHHIIQIIDSGASNHVTSSSRIFSTYSPGSGKQKNKVVNGSFSPIVGNGSVQISLMLSPKSVLQVPNLSYNLLSIGKLTNELHCFVAFMSTSCIF